MPPEQTGATPLLRDHTLNCSHDGVFDLGVGKVELGGPVAVRRKEGDQIGNAVTATLMSLKGTS